MNEADPILGAQFVSESRTVTLDTISSRVHSTLHVMPPCPLLDMDTVCHIPSQETDCTGPAENVSGLWVQKEGLLSPQKRLGDSGGCGWGGNGRQNPGSHTGFDAHGRAEVWGLALLEEMSQREQWMGSQTPGKQRGGRLSGP